MATATNQIWEAFSTLKDQDKLWAWLSQIARHAIVDYYRKRAMVVDPAEAPEDVAEESDEDHNRNAEILSCLSPMIEQLPERYREAILLTDLQGLTQKEMADKLGLSLSGAKSRVQRGREKLKEMLLDCCHFEFDRLGNVLDYERKGGGCVSCACGEADT